MTPAPAPRRNAGQDIVLAGVGVPAGEIGPELDPERMLCISWNGGRDLESTVSRRLVPEGADTGLLLSHDGFGLPAGLTPAAGGQPSGDCH